jgi:hypothetical protein
MQRINALYEELSAIAPAPRPPAASRVRPVHPNVADPAARSATADARTRRATPEGFVRRKPARAEKPADPTLSDLLGEITFAVLPVTAEQRDRMRAALVAEIDAWLTGACRLPRNLRLRQIQLRLGIIAPVDLPALHIPHRVCLLNDHLRILYRSGLRSGSNMIALPMVTNAEKDLAFGDRLPILSRHVVTPFEIHEMSVEESQNHGFDIVLEDTVLPVKLVFEDREHDWSHQFRQMEDRRFAGAFKPPAPPPSTEG